MKKILLSMLTVIMFAGATVTAQQIPVLELFHGRDCPHCHKELAWIPELQEMYPDLKIQEYEVWFNPQNQALFEQRMSELGQKAEGVPTNIINDEVVVGFKKQEILALMEKNYGSPTITNKTDNLNQLPWYEKLMKWFYSWQ